MQVQGHFNWKGLAGAASIDLKAMGRRDCGFVALQFACQGTHGMCVKGSVASVTRFERPRAVSHQQTLLMPHSSSPLSEPSLKELHTRRAPLGLGRHMQTKGLRSLKTAPLLGKLKLTTSASLQAANSSAAQDVRTQAWEEQVLHAAFFQLKLSN